MGKMGHARQLALALLSAPFLYGVAPSAAQDVTGEVRLFHRSPGAARTPLVAMFGECTKRYPNLKLVESFVPPEQYEVQLPVQLSSNSPPDLFAFWPGGRAVFQARSGKVMDISELWRSKIAPRVSSGVTEGVTEIDGKVYVVAYTADPNVMWYNKKIFDRLGLKPPKTWDEFLATAKTLKENNVTPVALGTRSGWEPLFWFDYLLLRTAGPEFRERLMWGQESYLDPKVIKVMEIWKGLLESGYFNENITSYGWQDMATSVASGRAAMQLMGPWTSRNFLEAGLKAGVDFDVFEFPVIDPSIPPAAQGSFAGFATSGTGRNTPGALALLDCITSLEAQSAYAATSQRLGVNKDVSIDAYDPPEFQPFMRLYKNLLQQSFHQNLELATLPGVTEVAKREFPRFLTYPDQFKAVLERLEQRSKSSFK